MSSSRHQSERLWSLIRADVEDRLTSEETDELEQLLWSDDAHARAYLDYVLLHADLMLWRRESSSLESALGLIGKSTQHIAVSEAATTEAVTIPPRPKSLLQWASRHPKGPAIAIAATVLIAALVVMGLVPVQDWMVKRGEKSNEQDVASQETQEFVARLSDWHNDQWLQGTRPPLDDPRLKIGKRLKIESGLIEVSYLTGARVVIEGPAEFVVGGLKAEGATEPTKLASREGEGGSSDFANSGYLTFGKLVARVEGEDAKGFTIVTPVGRVEDLGTEFGVHVTQGGRTQLHVFEGEVRVQASTESGTRNAVVSTGGSLVADTVGLTSLPSTTSEIPFVRRLPRARMGIVAAWSFDRDFTAGVGGKAFDLTAVGGASAGESVGRFGRAARFDRASSQYAFTGGNVLRQGKDHSYSAWYKLDVKDIVGNDRYFVLETIASDSPSKASAWSISYGLRHSDGDVGQVHTWTESGTGPFVNVAASNTTDSNKSKWNNIIVTYDADGGNELRQGRHEVYLNGDLVAAFDNDNPLAAVGGLVIGGHRTGTGRNWEGLIDDVAVFDRVLSAGEIRALQSTSVVAEFLKSNDNLNESAGVREQDSVRRKVSETHGDVGSQTRPEYSDN